MTTLARPPLPPPAPRPTVGFIPYQRYLEDPATEPHSEWVDGEVIPMPPVADAHSDVGGFLLAPLRVFVDVRQLGAIRYEPFQMKTGPDLPGRSPDILFVATRHLNRLQRMFLDGPADLVVEIVSPDSQTRDRVHKFAEYESGGVPEYWLIDPDRRTADYFRRGRAGRYKAVPLDRDGVYHCKALPGVFIKSDWLWQRPLPSTFDVLRAWGIV